MTIWQETTSKSQVLSNHKFGSYCCQRNLYFGLQLAIPYGPFLCLDVLFYRYSNLSCAGCAYVFTQIAVIPMLLSYTLHINTFEQNGIISTIVARVHVINHVRLSRCKTTMLSYHIFAVDQIQCWRGAGSLRVKVPLCSFGGTTCRRSRYSWHIMTRRTLCVDTALGPTMLHFSFEGGATITTTICLR